jgi:hypothetical protein
MAEKSDMLHAVEISLTTGVGPGNRVLIDEHEIVGVQRVVVEASIDGPPVVVLHLVPGDLLLRVNGAEVFKRIAELPDDEVCETTSIGNTNRTYWISRSVVQ